MGQIDFKPMPGLTALLILVLGLILAFTRSRGETIPRIVNGTAAKVGEFPFLVSIKMITSSRCSGSLITSKKVLTASHCFKKFDLICENCDLGVAVAGDVYWQENENTAKTRQERNLVTLAKHPKYAGKTEYDMAIVTTKTQFKLNKFVAVIGLAEVDLEFGDKCVNVGFGNQVTNTSQHVETDLAWFDSTVSKKTPDTIFTLTPFKKTHFGDSGSPLIDGVNKPRIHAVLHGIGYRGNHTESYYALLSVAKKWIIENLKSDRPRKGRSNDSSWIIVSVWNSLILCVIHYTNKW